MSTYNPYRTNTQINQNNIFDNINNNSRLSKLSIFGRSYTKDMIKQSKANHANEDLSITDVNGNIYTMFSRKMYAIMQERQTVAALNGAYINKINILREYATKVEIRDYLTKMTNEIVVYGKDKKFCEMTDLPDTYSEVIRTRIKDIFENIYSLFGLSDKSLAWDICHEWLVEGYICREIVYDQKRKNIIGSIKMDPASVIPIIDDETGITYWLQNHEDINNQKLLLDSEIIYISYSGSSNYMETSYIEPLIKPYNELKSIERSRLVFNLQQATLHKEIIIPVQDIPKVLQEQEIQQTITFYKDLLAFDDTTGVMYVDGQKDAPYSKEYWFPNNGNGRPEVNYIDPGGHDLNENITLNWFKKNLKMASKFPLNRLDAENGGGNVYSFGVDMTNDDFNFDKYIERLRTLFKDIILKPVIMQMLLEFPELEKNHKFFNDVDITYYGNSEMVEAKYLANLQAKAQIASELQNSLRKNDDTPAIHWKLLLKEIMKFPDEFIALNDKYWAEDTGDTTTVDGGSGIDMSGGGAQPNIQAQPGQAQIAQAETETQIQAQPEIQAQIEPE